MSRANPTPDELRKILLMVLFALFALGALWATGLYP